MASLNVDVEVIAHVVQLAIAPVFLLTGVAALLGVMTARLARVIDRARLIEERWHQLEITDRNAAEADLVLLRRRASLSSWAINFCAFAALLVCVVIATLFVDAFISANLTWLVGALFVITMLALMIGLVSFLLEVYLATHTLRIGAPAERDGTATSLPCPDAYAGGEARVRPQGGKSG